MPSLTINGHSVTVDDSFDKLSPEEQNATVDHIAKQLHEEAAPSGVVAGFAHGVSGVAGGDASTLGLGGVKSDTLDSIAAHAEPKDYKAAHLIQNGHLNISALPQKLAEMAPGLGQDFAAGYTGSKIGGMLGPAGRAIGGLGGFSGSMLLRNFGPGAHENADARTGVPNSPVETPDLVREGVKQAVELPVNMFAGSRLLPGGGKLAGNALAKYITSVGTGGAQAGLNDVVDQVGTTLGTKDGVKYDPTRTLEAGATGLAGGSALFAPRLAADVHSNAKYGRFETDPETKAAAEALASRHLDIADGRKIDAKVGAEAVGGAHRDVHTELAAASKGEDLSQDNANTLKRINDGAKASPGEVAALADEASPETMHLARQALLSAQVKKLGDFSDDKFTGGISSKMEKTLRPIYNPTGTAAAVGAGLVGHAGGLGMLGTFAPQALAAIYGSYGAARVLDKLTGARSPAQGFTDRFGGTDTPTRFEPPVQEQPLEDTGPTPQALKKEALSNIQVHEGMARIAKQLADQKKKDMVSEASPLLKQLAIKIKPVADPAAVSDAPASPEIAQAMQTAASHTTPPAAPAPSAAPPGAPVASTADILSKLNGKSDPNETVSGAAVRVNGAVHRGAFHPDALDNAAKHMGVSADELFNSIPFHDWETKQTTPGSGKHKVEEGFVTSTGRFVDRAEAGSIAANRGQISQKRLDEMDHPDHHAYRRAELAKSLQADFLDAATPAPQAPVIAKITKKLNGNGKVEETPHPEAEQPYMPLPEEALWRKGLSDEQVAEQQSAKYNPDADLKEVYEKNIRNTRKNKRDIIGKLAALQPADATEISALGDQLDHISNIDKARQAVSFHAGLMSAKGSVATHSRFNEKLLKILYHRARGK